MLLSQGPAKIFLLVMELSTLKRHEHVDLRAKRLIASQRQVEDSLPQVAVAVSFVHCVRTHNNPHLIFMTLYPGVHAVYRVNLKIPQHENYDISEMHECFCPKFCSFV